MCYYAKFGVLSQTVGALINYGDLSEKMTRRVSLPNGHKLHSVIGTDTDRSAAISFVEVKYRTRFAKRAALYLLRNIRFTLGD